MNSIKKIYDKEIGYLLALVLSLPLLTNFFGGIARMVGASTIDTTRIIYFAVFLIGVNKLRCCNTVWFLNLLKLYIFMILVLLLNYAFFPMCRPYYSANSLSLGINLIFYIPVAYALVRVKDWTYFFEYMKYTAILTPIAGWIGIKFLNFEDMISYMIFSNNVIG